MLAIAADVRRTSRHIEIASIAPEARALELAVGERYRIVREVGRGGMGVIFLAEDRTLGRVVAIKALRVELAGSEAQRERFGNEARALARLSHTGIVRLHDYRDEGALPYMVMDYVDGETLGAMLDRERYLDGPTVARLVAALAEAVDHAHAAGLVHRDLKPENVIVAASGAPVLIDFGVALTASRVTALEAGRAVGTPHYMSPEQAAGDARLDARSDVYSLGVLAYHLLSGQLPFDGGTYGAIAAQHVIGKLTPLRRVAPHVPEGLARVVERALAKERAARWPSARELARALQRTNEGRARSDGAGNHGVRFLARLVG